MLVSHFKRIEERGVFVEAFFMYGDIGFIAISKKIVKGNREPWHRSASQKDTFKSCTPSFVEKFNRM